jgi:Ca2+-binding RTX toxin-like protein
MAEVRFYEDEPFYQVRNGTGGNDSLFGLTDPANPPPLDHRSFDSHLPQDELFRGFGGDDRIFGGDGYDVIYGGSGKDILNGGTGFGDWLFGGGSNDFLTDPDTAHMYGQGGADVLRSVITAYTSTQTGGMGADQFRIRAVGLHDIDDVHGGIGNIVIEDFHAHQGDKILLTAKLAGGQALSGQAVFDLLDTNDDLRLDEHDGSSALGRVTWDGIYDAYENEKSPIGSLHLRLGETEVEVAHTEFLTAHDFLL